MNVIILLYPCQITILEQVSLDRGVTAATYLIYMLYIQKMCQDFQKMLAESITLGVEPEPSTSTSTESHGSSPTWVLKMHQQHVTAYTRIMMEGGMELTMGEKKAAPLITEVCSPMSTS